MSCLILGEVYPLFNKKIEVDPKWQKTSFKFIINSTIFLLIGVSDLYIVEIVAHNEVYVDQFSAILSISGIIWLLTNAIYSFISARISALIKNKRTKQLQHLINSANTTSVILVSIVFIILLLFGKIILSFFGKEYAVTHAYIAFIITITGYYIGIFSRSATLLLSYSDNLNHIIWNGILEWSALLILGTLLTIKYNIIGIASASTIAISIKTIHAVILTRYKLKLKPLTIL